MAPTLLLYGIPSIVDERCLYQLFNHKVKQALFSGFNLGRIAIVELTEDALTTAVLRQSCAGLILANSLNAKKAQKAIRANARKEAEEAKKKNKRGGKKGSKGEEEKEEKEVDRTDSLDDPSKGITLLELLHQEFGGQALAPTAASSSSSSGTSATSSPSTPSQFMAQFGGATPEFGLYSTILINGHRVGVAVSPLTIDEFKAFGGEMATRPPPRNNKSDTAADPEANDGQQAPPRKQRRTEANAELKTDESETAAIETSEVPTSSSGSSSTATANVAKHSTAAGKKEVVLQSTRMRNVNQQAPAFGAALSSAASKNKITFSDDDDDDDVKPKKTAVAEDKQKEVKKKDAAEDSSNGDAAPSSLNNRERKKLAKAAASTTASKFKFADSDSD